MSRNLIGDIRKGWAVPATIGLINALVLASTFYAWRFAYFWLDDFNAFFWVQRLDQSFWRMAWDCVNPFANSFRPFGILFYGIFWRLFGLSPLPYHFFAWAIHTVNVILLFVLLSRITGSRYGAAVGALLFGFRANFTDIYWSFGTIFELLALLLMLLALLAYSSEARFQWKLAAAALLYLLAVKSKEMAITLPALLLLYDISFRRYALTRKTASLYGMLGVFGLAFGYAKFTGMSSPARNDPYYMDISAITLGRGYGWYFDHLYGLRLRWGAWMIAAAVVLAWCAYRREKRVPFFVGYVFITLLPVIFLVNHRYEFFWYIPFFGIAGLVAVMVARMEDWLKYRVPLRAAAVSGVLAFAVLGYCHYWREWRASADLIRNQHSIAAEFEAFAETLRQLPPPLPDSTIYFKSLPGHFDPQGLTSATQVVLRRTDVTVRISDVFPNPCRSCVSFKQ